MDLVDAHGRASVAYGAALVREYGSTTAALMLKQDAYRKLIQYVYEVEEV